MAHRTALHRLWLRTLAFATLHALLLALVLAPSLGHVHRALHAPGQPAHFVHLERSANNTAAFTLKALFSPHQASDCLWLDQLTLADAAPSAPPALAHSAPHAHVWADTPLAPHWQRRQAAFQARAPPLWLA
ncbi:MAG: hypothetical protein KA216_07020 [Giesbergeria sp.]|nr:hypothetical protein [Giesbergeria sp.]